MAEIKHTPGPWEFGKERRWLFRDNLKHDGVFSSSTILKVNDDAFRPTDADASLIAAAPELLEALKAVLANDGGKGSEQFHASKLFEAREQGFAAIVKAEGSL